MPVMYQACKIPDKMEYDLAELQWTDFHDMPFDAAFENLVRALGGKPTVDLASSREVQALRSFVESRSSPRPLDASRFCSGDGTTPVRRRHAESVLTFRVDAIVPGPTAGRSHQPQQRGNPRAPALR